MCLADLVQGRNIVSVQSSFTLVANVAAIALEGNINRVGILFSNASTAPIFIRRLDSAAGLNGIVVVLATSPILFLSKWHGDFVTSSIEAVSGFNIELAIIEMIIPPDIAAKFDEQLTING